LLLRRHDPVLPGLCDLLDLTPGEIGERAHVAGGVDDDFLPSPRRPPREEAALVSFVRPRAKGGELVRDHAHPPARRVRGPAGRADGEGFRRGCRLPPGAEGTARDVVLGLLGLGPRRTRPASASGRDHDPASRHRVSAQLRRGLDAQLDLSLLKNGLKSSSGMGRIRFEVRSEDISNIVCRKRSWIVIGFSLMTLAASLRRSDAWNSPSAAMTFARRSRSASACRAIARCIPVGISTSLTSTMETLMPQGDVASSMIS